MPSVGSCLTCMEDYGVGPVKVEPPTVAFMFAAKYPSTCRKCGNNTEEGDRIAKMSDDSYRCCDCAWLHE